MTMTRSCTGGIVASMKFTLEASSRVNLIRAYSAQEIRIGEQRVHGTCIVTADQLITQWAPASLDDLTEAHLETLLALQPELVLLGTGPVQRFPPAAIRAAVMARGVGIEVMDLGAACRTFNILVQEERRVAAALFLK
ncbi:MAG TPA: Mth938-like domain-containing protein [Steroidobacteraceae bacterium]|nr:Mth938-like domain-containing protein [Steroidobacteraceae bacterium]